LTRASSESTLGIDVARQLLGERRPLWIAGSVMLGLAMIPGLPKLSFVCMAALMMMLARRAKPDLAAAGEGASATSAAKGQAAKSAASDSLDSLLKLDDLMLEVGLGLVPLVDSKQGGQLLGKVRSLRKSLASQLGFLVPPIHITDNLARKEREYVIYLRGVEVARWELRRDCLLAISSQSSSVLPGQDTREPAFNTPAKWISPDLQAQALAAGYVVVDHTSALATHLSEVIRQNAHLLLTRQESKRLIDRLGESHPKLVEELIPKVMTLGEVQKVLQQLLREQVSIRDLGTILETLVEVAPLNKNPVLLVEAVRHALGRALVRPLLDERGQLKVVTLDRSIEEECARAMSPQQAPAPTNALQPSTARRISEGLRALFGEQVLNAPPVLLCSSPGRFHLRRILEPFFPGISVLSPTEIPPLIPVQSIGALR
jgi:flagellar biosynthesis protein FlhA